ncbi:hypothetical protein LX32DRAFT_723107 [Colletotrichum zoysiae]|uniref:Mutanase n=1 Tax=Colletotrichum zoysiae TaxID=1216348 RepID=A0AAD9HEV7_9PEZI|nr:hypothetical protein LX32DRAFT_723107 [Colletotrichum zoysiae]
MVRYLIQAESKRRISDLEKRQVGNTAEYTDSDWEDDINKAKEAHIDAFALNMAQGEDMNDKSVMAAFAKAEQLGFQLFFSFDYAGNGPWKKQVVIDMIKKYGSSPAHFHHKGKPFVSTFEGPAQADDWIDIKAQTGCFFVPDWSSLGAKKAIDRAGGVADGNTASQVQMEFRPSALVSDEVFFSALLTEEAEVQVVIGGSPYRGTWRNKPEGGAGIYHGGVPFDGREGGVEVRLIRGGRIIMSVTGPDIGRVCNSNGYNNFNPTTGGKTTTAPRSVTVPSLSNQICIGGWGANDFGRLCEFTCSYGYCPKGACVCTALGTEFSYPNGTGPPGYALEGRGSSYAGLCSSACSYGFCPEEACGLTQHPLVEPMVSPFQPPACVSGTGPGDLAALCSFTCRHGYCPIAACTCTSQGELDWLDPTYDIESDTLKDDGYGLCSFACSRGYCPFDKCVQRVGGDKGDEDGDGRDLEVVNLNQTCFRTKECVDIEDDEDKLGYSKACGNGYKRVGWDKSICSGIGGTWGQPICCKRGDAPEKCMWRGNGGDCNGQCHEGEVTLYQSGDGGWPVESGGNQNQCSRGYKYFCCSMDSYDELTERCYWSGCETSCKDDEQDLATAVDTPDQSCSLFKYMSHYCCKTSQPPLRDCHWVGKGDCADNTCSANEVTLRTDSLGDSLLDCLWGRKKALCCTPNDDVFDTPTCGKNLCEYPGSEYSCDPDLYADDYSNEDECEPEFCDVQHTLSHVDRRGKREPFKVTWQQVINDVVRKFRLELQMRRYPGSSNLHSPTRGTPASSNAFRLVQNNCRSTEIEVLDRTTMSSAHVRSTYDTEHNPDGQYIRDFVRTLATGILPDGSSTSVDPIPGPDLEDNWNAKILPSNLPRAGSSMSILTPNGYLFDRLGSQGNRFPLLLCERTMNQMKGRIFNLRQQSPTDDSSDSDDDDPENDVGERPNPADDRRFAPLLDRTTQGNVTAQNEMFDILRMAIGVFRYINHPDALPTVQRNRRELRTAVMAIAQVVAPLRDAAAIHQEFDSNWYREGADRTLLWVTNRILQVRAAFSRLHEDDESPPNAPVVREILDELNDQLHYIKAPPDI